MRNRSRSSSQPDGRAKDRYAERYELTHTENAALVEITQGCSNSESQGFAKKLARMVGE